MTDDAKTLSDDWSGARHPERLERRVKQCAAITADGTQCTTFTLHRECWRHRRQTARTNQDGDAP
jgi:hypothetical protein